MAELKSQVTFRVADETYERLNEIAHHERRKQNEAARALLERGMAAYERDGHLFEPNNSGTSDNSERTSTHPKRSIKMETIQGRRSPKRDRKTANDK